MTIKFEDVLSQGKNLYYTNVGDSMLPLIREGKDILIIAPRPFNRLKKNDIPLYKRDSGQYVLHRIVKVRKKDYLLRGDNRYFTEKGITDKHIIGILVAIIRDGKYLSLDDEKYLSYVKKLNKTYIFKFLKYKLLRFLYKLKRF